ncbi:centrosomal protein of 170 kDa protein B isoform 5-T5 [Anomaloglossus baeobatrachus]|uniref:centrosomal protein of 170 kDa protein B isoform X6 n=1 Tax=Anomaloglossus baeobatrachus TaxID=238106 RepID=UPI003F509DA4
MAKASREEKDVYMVASYSRNKMSVTSWFLVSGTGTRHRLPREMIFVGREDCELMLQSRSVDKQHAVINYDSEKDEHRVKDLGSLNGTFVNDVRIPDQKYITLKLNDVIRFGYDFNMYVLEQIQHKVPEEALKHEKYTSQLQMSLKTAISSRPEQVKEQPPHVDSTSGKQEKADKKAASSEPSIYRTPLYGQPSWWGDDDANNMHEQHEGRRPEDHYPDRPKELSQLDEEMNDSLGYRDPSDQSLYSFRREPSYFEIPTKDFQQPAKSPETQVHEIPTKDTDTVTPPVMQSHASFTIEFDDCRPGRIKIKDHVTKFSMRQRRTGGKEPGPNEMISVENKVADWLVQNDPSLIRRPSPGEDVYSTKSDLPIHNKILKGNRHEDGTQSDSEDPSGPVPEKENVQSDQIKLQRQIKREPEELLHNQQAFVIEFFDDDAPRKKRSQSFTHSANSSQNEADPANKGKNDKRKVVLAAEKLTTNGTTTAPPVPKPLVNSSFPQRSNSFRREKTEDRISTAGPVTAKPPVKSFGSIGKKSKLAQEFVAEYLREQAEVSKDPVEKPMTLLLSSVITPSASQQVQSSIMGPSAPRCVTPPPECRPMRIKKAEEEDSLSDAGTYTIETENQDKEVEEARKMIDQVFGVFEPEEYSKISSSIYRPVIKLEKEEETSLNENIMNHNPAILCTSHPVKTNSEPPADVQAEKSSGSGRGGQKWVSRWASLADSYPDASPTSPLDGQKSGLLANDASRRRQQGSDYISTSEEEYGSNHSTPKHKRSHTSTATQTPRTHNVSARQRQSTLQDDDDDDQEVYNTFMAQSEEIAEIARLSQTLVNDVASLAKEIHDVAGDGDSQSSSGTGHSTSISSIPNTPASIISAREEILKRTSQRPYPSQLVHHIPEASLNYQKVPPGSIGLKDFDQNMNDNRDDDPIRRRARNREEVIFDNLMLNPVSQLSHTICTNTEVLTEKMKVLFLNKEKSWEEIEAKINSENEVPILKTSNKEISSILKVLRRVQKQLEVINAIIEPSGHLEVIPTNKKTSPVIQTLTPQARTHNSVSKTESHQPVRIRNYMHKSSSGSSRSPESSFGRDEEDAYIV